MGAVGQGCEYSAGIIDFTGLLQSCRQGFPGGKGWMGGKQGTEPLTEKPLPGGKGQAMFRAVVKWLRAHEEIPEDCSKGLDSLHPIRAPTG